MSTKARNHHPLQDLDEDIRLHIEIETQDNIAKGMPPEEAHYAAVRKFGNITKIKEETHEIWNPIWLEQFLQDIRYGLRILKKNPGFTAIAVLTLALGIGANTAIFSVVYAVLLKPLPYPQATQLFTIFQIDPEEGVKFTGMSYPNLTDLRQQNSVFTEIAGTQQHQLTLIGRGEPTVVNASVATPELFAVFEVKPLAGRIFYSEDGKHGATPVTILSENLWRALFNADPNIVGSAITLDKRAFTVVGIMPAAFRFPNVNQPDQLWVPLVQDPVFGQWMDRRGGHYLRITARLKPSVSTAQAQTELDAIGARLANEDPTENRGWLFRMMPLHSMMIENVKPALLVLFGAVALVLLIACTNLANLLLTRATSRAREIAVRTALGAGRKRIVRQLLTEAAVLGLLGGIAGIGLAYFGVQALSTLIPADFPHLNAIRVDNLVLAFALVLAVLASCAFGLAPALFAANSNLQSNLREGGARSGELATRRRARSYLAAAEIALAMVLLVAAGLFLRSFSKLISVNPGFDTEHTLQANIDLPISQYATPKQWAAFSSTLLANLQAQPGLQNSAIVSPQAHHRRPGKYRLRHRRQSPANPRHLAHRRLRLHQPRIFPSNVHPAPSRPSLRSTRHRHRAKSSHHQPATSPHLFPKSKSHRKISDFWPAPRRRNPAPNRRRSRRRARCLAGPKSRPHDVRALHSSHVLGRQSGNQNHVKSRERRHHHPRASPQNRQRSPHHRHRPNPRRNRSLRRPTKIPHACY